MNEFEQLQVAEAPLREFDVDFPGNRRRRMIIGLVSVLVLAVLVASAVLFVNMNNRIHSLDRTTTAQSRQIQQLQSDVTSVKASLGAAVACLQTVGSSQGLCSKLVK
jgi:flagellar basal body-associated protein FliL